MGNVGKKCVPVGDGKMQTSKLNDVNEKLKISTRLYFFSYSDYQGISISNRATGKSILFIYN